MENGSFKILLKRICALAVAIIICITLVGCGETAQVLEPTEQFYVNDFADVLTPEDEQTILSKGAALAEQTKAQVVAVTVETTNGKEISDFALELGRNWGVGDSEENSGVLVVLATRDRQVYIAVGYGLEGALPDSKTGRIIDNRGIPYFSIDDFSNGMVSLYGAVVDEIYVEYNLPPSEDYVLLQGEENIAEENYGLKVALSWLILIAIVFVYLLFFRRLSASHIFFIGSGFSGRGGFGGGSGFSGGGFRGGGGSFGGGGAGRGF